MIDRQEARSDVARIDPAADRWLHTANRARATTDPRVGRLVKSRIRDNRRGQPDLGAMEGPHPGGTALLITVYKKFIKVKLGTSYA
jgi:hypothetical protein